MRATVTISLPISMKQKLEKYLRKEHLSRSDVVRDALRLYLSVQEFRKLRDLAMLEGEKRGRIKEEDVFREVS